MELSSRFVGTPLKDFHKEITWRETMNYAAAVADPNPFYFDDEREGGIIAPPLFAVAATWPVVGRIWEFIEAEDFPREVLTTQVHYFEHLAFHRPLRPGDSITIKGKIAAVLPHRAGTQVVLCFEALDSGEGLVFTEHLGGLLRGVSLSEEGRGAEALPAVPPGPEEGRPLWETGLRIDPLRPFLYDGCANIFFPIHTSRRFARQVGLPGIILQGTATLALAAREIINREASGNPLRLKTLSCRFTGMVFPGSEVMVRLAARIEQEKGTDLYFSVLNQEGRPAVSGGYAFLKNL